jgi:hypothetical protein
VLLAFVLLPGAVGPTPEAVGLALAERQFDATLAKPDDDDDDDDASIPTFTYELDSGSLIVAHMPGAIATGEVEAAAELSLGRFGDGPPLAPHVTHLTVVLTATEPASLDAVTEFTLALAAVVEAAGAVGVYWGSGHVAHEASFFVAMAETEMPLMLWSGVGVAVDDADGTEGKTASVLSTGLRQFGLPELCVRAPLPQANEALACLFDFAGYVLRRGRPLPDGDTIGRTAEEKILVTYEPSPFVATARTAEDAEPEIEADEPSLAETRIAVLRLPASPASS